MIERDWTDSTSAADHDSLLEMVATSWHCVRENGAEVLAMVNLRYRNWHGGEPLWCLTETRCWSIENRCLVLAFVHHESSKIQTLAIRHVRGCVYNSTRFQHRNLIDYTLSDEIWNSDATTMSRSSPPASGFCRAHFQVDSVRPQNPFWTSRINAESRTPRHLTKPRCTNEWVILVRPILRNPNQSLLFKDFISLNTIL
jgi:hypothetical protein